MLNSSQGCLNTAIIFTACFLMSSLNWLRFQTDPFIAARVHIIPTRKLLCPELQDFSVILRLSHTHTHTHAGVQHPPQGHQTAGGLTNCPADHWKLPCHMTCHMTCVSQERLTVQEDTHTHNHTQYGGKYQIYAAKRE